MAAAASSVAKRTIARRINRPDILQKPGFGKIEGETRPVTIFVNETNNHGPEQQFIILGQFRVGLPNDAVAIMTRGAYHRRAQSGHRRIDRNVWVIFRPVIRGADQTRRQFGAFFRMLFNDANKFGDFGAVAQNNQSGVQSLRHDKPVVLLRHSIIGTYPNNVVGREWFGSEVRRRGV